MLCLLACLPLRAFSPSQCVLSDVNYSRGLGRRVVTFVDDGIGGRISLVGRSLVVYVTLI